MSSLKRTRSHRRIWKIQCRLDHAMNEDQRIELCKSSLTQIYTMLRTAPADWRNYTNLARTIITNLDSTTFMQQPSRSQEQSWVIAGLQRFAFADHDSGGLPDIVAWCARQWLTIVQREPQNITALRGVGQMWLSRAQPPLSRIHGCSDSPPTSNNGSNTPRRPRSRESDSNGSSRSSGEAEQRIGTADYVEARGYLQPATEFFERAVAAAAAQQASSGDLLATTAEAYLSLGHASSPRTNEPHFRRAVQLLQIASTVPDYALSRYLQRYLDEYGRLLD